MTPEKAIEILNQYLNDPESVDIMDLCIAQRFGIEALEQLQGVRIGNIVPGSKLPSEDPK